jgi:hypothetical protein
MKRIATVLFAVITLLAAGCVSVKAPADLGIYDVSVPAEEQCTLLIGYPSTFGFFGQSYEDVCTIYSFDGEQVIWPIHSKILIPAGKHTLAAEGRSSNTSYYTPYGGNYTEITRTTVSGTDTAEHIFEAGKTYRVSFGSKLWIREIQ